MVNVILVKDHKKEAWFTSDETQYVDKELANALLLKAIPFAMKKGFDIKETAYNRLKEWIENPANKELYHKGSLIHAVRTYYVNLDLGFLSYHNGSYTEYSGFECGDYEVTADIICSDKKMFADVYCMQFDYQAKVKKEEK